MKLPEASGLCSQGYLPIIWQGLVELFRSLMSLSAQSTKYAIKTGADSALEQSAVIRALFASMGEAHHVRAVVDAIRDSSERHESVRVRTPVSR